MFKLGESEQTFLMLKSTISMEAIRNRSLNKKKGQFLLPWVHVEGRERKCRIAARVNWKKMADQHISV